MISTATKTLQANNKMIYVALLSTLTFFLFLDYIPGLEAWSACTFNGSPSSQKHPIRTDFHGTFIMPYRKLLKLKIRIRHFIRLS